MAKRGLGKGLEALFPGVTIDKSEKKREPVTEILVEQIEAGPFQPRKIFADDKLNELAASIQEHGVVQPIIVRPLGGERYQLIAGERRWRACLSLGKEKIPALIREVDEVEAREISLVENLQREELNPLEEAEAYRQLLQEFGFTQETLAKRLGKSRSYIANALRLLGLSETLQHRLREGTLTTGHAKVILGVTDLQERERLGEEVVSSGLSVRETEKLVQDLIGHKPKEKVAKRSPSKVRGSNQEDNLDPDFLQFEDRLRNQLGTRVKVKWAGASRGRIEIEFYSLEDLERLEEILRLTTRN